MLIASGLGITVLGLRRIPVTHPYGERQYNAEDFAGRSWTFSQSMAYIHPDAWGGTAEHLDGDCQRTAK